MKKSVRFPLLMVLLAGLMLLLPACGQKTALSAKEPVELTFWHVYGEQADSPMDTLVAEFNRTVGLEKGIRINVTGSSSAARIGEFLQESLNGDPGAREMPDLFTCHLNDALALGAEHLLDWNQQFTADELSDFVPGFLADGTDDGRLLVFPLAKSTHVLMLNGTGFARFSAATGAAFGDMTTWEGFYDTAARYYTYSGGTPLCAMDYPLRAVELRAMELGAGDFYTADGWYDFNNTILKESWMMFARALVQGHVVVSDLYSNTQVMTGEVLAGLGSSAAILYYNDTVSYEDGHSEPMDLQVQPMPMTAGAQPLMTQAGVGLCAYKTTAQKAEAAAVFARWLTEAERNLDFVVQTGYMPVRNGAFDGISSGSFDQQSYENLYTALRTMHSSYTPVSEPRFAGYYGRVSALYDGLRQMQQELPARAAAGEDVDTLAEETWALFCSL